MVLEPVKCPCCGGINIIKYGLTSNDKQRYICKDDGKTFILEYSDLGRLPEVKQKIVDMAVNGSGIRDTARVLNISPDTVINELKKKEQDLQSVNRNFLENNDLSQVIIKVVKVEEIKEEIHNVTDNNVKVEVDEMWSYVGNKDNQRWLWHAIDHITGTVLAYVLGPRQDQAFLDLKKLLAPFNITHFYTDDWGAYQRHIDADQHIIGKQYTQKIERKHLTLRTRIKRLTRKTICFSKLEQMHDIVIGLFVNRYEFGVAV